MKISWKWLNSLLPLNHSPHEIAALLTDCGLEVESIDKSETVPGGLKGVVVGEVVDKIKHPDADKLSVTKVNVGQSELLNIVCGAPNVAAGQKVLVALIGTRLHPTSGNPLEIKKSKIRGVVSEGMICAEDELGIGTSHDGILILSNDAIPGTSASDYLKLEDDVVFEIGLTPNRSDAASHYGVARDLAAVLNCKTESNNYQAKLSGIHELPPPSGTLTTQISIINSEACKRYCGLTITGVQVKESPEWLKNCLHAIGLRPINNIVDITNFVLHETGQPLHAFDAFKIKGQKIEVKKCSEGTTFTTLDGTERKLSAHDLMICDTEKPLCLAGVFGGLYSGVTEETTAVFLESAYFDPSHIRSSSKRHGLKTDASFRFERGTDPEMTIPALLRAAHLILECCGGTISSELTDYYPDPIPPAKIAFSYANCFSLIGKEIPKTTVKNILTSLGIQIVTEGNDGLVLNVPAYKTDVNREADITEEILRVYGYNNVEESGKFCFSVQNDSASVKLALENKIADLFSSQGFREIMNTSLSKEHYYHNGEQNISVVNPLSADLNVLRRTLVYGGLETIAYNLNRKNQDLKFFEFGRVYSKNISEENSFPYEEEKRLALFVTGKVYSENAYQLQRESDFYGLKSYVHLLLEKTGINSFKALEATTDFFEFGQQYTWKKKTLVVFGKLKKSVLKSFDIRDDVYVAEFNWDLITQAASANAVNYKEVARFPGVRRDLALLLDKKIEYREVEELAYNCERKFLKNVHLFDVYEGDKIDAGKKSYAISFLLQNEEATLTDKQIDNVMEKLIQTYQQKLGAILR